MSAKAQKTKARLPRGFVDREPGDLRATQTMLSAIQGVYERYGFAPIETPLVEFTDVLGKFLPDEDRPNAGVFSFLDDDEQWLSLRYDLTAPLARYVAENFQDMPKPYRSYRCGPVFRNEKAGPGRFRQFMQFDADTVGAPGPAADAEMCMMMADVMEAVGIGRGDYRIRVNNRKVLDGFMAAVGLEGEGAAPRRLKVLRAIDKLDRLGIEGVEALLGQGRRDESGDFTEGAQLEPGSIRMLLDSFAEPSKDGSSAVLEAMRKSPAGSVGATAEGIGELEQMATLFAATGYDETRIGIDPSVVRGLEYYTGPVFEAELTFPVTNEKGEAVVFGSVGGGGRYDGLVARFTGQSVPATGTSIGVSRLLSALTNLGRLDMAAVPGPILVTVMDRGRVGDYMRLAAEIREGLNRDRAPGEPPIAVEMYQGNPKQFGKQLQYADRRDSPCVIIDGEDELAKGVLEVKDLIEGKRLSAEIEDNVTWREARPAQITVPRGDIVAALRRLLDAQAADRASAAR